MNAGTAILLVGAVGAVAFFAFRSRAAGEPRQVIVQNPGRNDVAQIISSVGDFSSGIGDLVQAFSDSGEKQAPTDAGWGGA